jgi:ATP-binding cassette subfamily B protein
MFLAAYLVVESSTGKYAQMTVGDFILVQQFILTLYEPLGYLGTYYRVLKQSLTDVESMMDLLDETIDIQDVSLDPMLIASSD